MGLHYKDLEKFRTLPLYLGSGTWKIPISPPIWYGHLLWVLGLGKIPSFSLPWDLGKIPNAPFLYRPRDLGNLNCPAHQVTVPLKHIHVVFLPKNFLGEPKNKDHVLYFSIWGGEKFRVFPILKAHIERGKRLPLWAYVLSVHGSCLGRSLPRPTAVSLQEEFWAYME